MIELTPEEWQLYLDKYENLIFTIAYRITGDPAVSEFEDNVSDLHQAALESINGFNKKTGKNFGEMISDDLFDKYTKTCLWHKKANKGRRIKNRYPLTNSTVSSTDNDELLAAQASASFEGFAEDMSPNLTDLQATIINAVIRDSSLLLKTGKINCSAVARELQLPIYVVNGEVKKLSRIIRNTL